MKNTLKKIIASIVDNPDKIEINEREDENGVLNFEITVDESDIGRLIGKGGKVIKSIRNVMKIPAIKENKKIFVSLSENLQNK